MPQRHLKEILNSHLTWLLSDGKDGFQADLRSLDLSGYDLSGLDLRNIDFSFSNLDLINFEYSDLRGSNFNFSTIVGTCFKGAKYESSQLDDAVRGKDNQLITY